MRFEKYIGIDYSGSGSPLTRAAGLQVYIATPNELPRRLNPPGLGSRDRNWCRREVAKWLMEEIGSGGSSIAGMDFSFSLPLSYFQRYGLTDWGTFLEDFVKHWPTDQDDATVKMLRPGNPRTGMNNEFRITERWTSSAKSNFQFGVPGQVACSTHTGIPWLYQIRQTVGAKAHFWPFDGWKIRKGRSVLAEVYPPMFRNRFPREGRTVDQQDAYAIARWLKEMDYQGILEDTFFRPPITGKDRKIADLEGWILGVI